MSSIYIANQQGQQTSYEEQEARRLWATGVIPRDSSYWREGMPEWRPATEYFALPESQSAQSVPPLIPLHQVVRGFAKDPATLTKVLIGFLWVYLGVGVISSLTSTIALVTGQAAKVDSENLTAMDLVNLLVGLPQLLITIGTGVVFLMWIYRANLNTRGLGAKGMLFTPGWSVGYYFIPIVNLWKPYRAMKEIWQASENPISWPSQEPPKLLTSWWGLWIASCILGNAAMRASFRANSASELMASELVNLLSDLVGIPLCLVAMRMVREIIRMQSHWAAQPAPTCCTVCQQPFAESEMILLNGSAVCARCKPSIVQGMQEGLTKQAR